MLSDLRLQPRSCRVSHIDVSGQGLAIFEADHSPSPLLKIACTFLRNTLLGRLQGEAEVRRAAVKLLDDAVSVAALVLIRARILVAHAEAHRPVEEDGDLSRCGRQGLGLADTCGKAPVKRSQCGIGAAY